jgi:hypothetical protein
MKTSIIRFFAALALLVSLSLSPLARSVQASGATVPTIGIISVKAGESVTIRTYNFPANQLFTVRMGKYGTLGVNGIVVTTTNSGAGGSFDETYVIPAELRSDQKIAIRMDSSSGYYAYNWFTNQTSSSPSTPAPTSVPTQPPPSSSPGRVALTVLGVDQNVSVKVRADYLPANQTFTIRVGPYYTFFTDYVVMGTLNSGSGGTLEFTTSLPSVVHGVELVTIRIDSSQHFYGYTAFKNVPGGTTGSPAATPVPVTPVPATPGAVSGACQLISISPTSSLTTYQDFDTAWEVKNTSGKTWEMTAVDYKYISGTAMHEKAVYDLQKSVANGETFKIIVDMKAPSSAGSYTANWALVQSSTTLCNLKVTVSVK